MEGVSNAHSGESSCSQSRILANVVAGDLVVYLSPLTDIYAVTSRIFQTSLPSGTKPDGSPSVDILPKYRIIPRLGGLEGSKPECCLTPSQPR